jgi:hypothetical protein
MVQRGNMLSIFLPAGGQENACLRLYNLQGRQIRTWNIVAGEKTTVSINGFGRGIYYGKLIRGNTERLVKVMAVRP